MIIPLDQRPVKMTTRTNLAYHKLIESGRLPHFRPTLATVKLNHSLQYEFMFCMHVCLIQLWACSIQLSFAAPQQIRAPASWQPGYVQNCFALPRSASFTSHSVQQRKSAIAYSSSSISRCRAAFWAGRCQRHIGCLPNGVRASLWFGRTNSRCI